MDPIEQFDAEKRVNVQKLGRDSDLQTSAFRFLEQTSKYKYTYNFTWLGRPIIQTPQDVMAMQEIIWSVRPDLIVETGIAHGGSLVLSASMLELLGGSGRVLGIDIDIRPHNQAAIERHPLAKRIAMIQGSSIADQTVSQVREIAKDAERVMVILDSNHTHAHVLRELQLYSPLVGAGSYLVVMDTAIEDMPADFFPDRPWGKGNNPKTAVHEFLRTNDRFQIDKDLEAKLLITVAPDGYLRCVK